jgi:hypothetical protein
MPVRPTIEEQLAGVKRVLETVVAPAMPAGYPAEMLRWSAEALGRLARQQGLAEANLRWEAAATAALLARLSEAGGDEPAPAGDLAGLQVQVLALRGRLAEQVRTTAFRPGAEALTRELVAHARACAARSW